MAESGKRAKGKTGPKLSPTERAIVRERIVNLDARGYGPTEIARRVGLAQSTVTRVLQKVQAEYNARSERITKVEVERKLVELRALKAELYEAWERSKSERQVSEQQKTEGAGANGGQGVEIRKTKLKKELRDGNVYYANAIRGVIKEENELMGLYPPKRTEHSGIDGGPIETTATIIRVPPKMDKAGWTAMPKPHGPPVDVDELPDDE